MARYIDADAIMPKVIESEKFIFRKEDVYECRELVFKTCYEDLEDIICKIPTADVVEVKHGEWVYWQPDGTNHLWNCSVCGGAISTPMKFVADHIKYCEHCGAKMDGERKCDNG